MENHTPHIILISCGLSLQWLEQGLSSQTSRGGENTRFQSLEQWWVTRALALQLCRKEFPQRQKVTKQVKYVLKGIHVDRHTGRLRERPWVAPSRHFRSLTWGISPGFTLAILMCPIHSSYVVYLRTLPCVHMHLLAKMDLKKSCMGKASLDVTAPLTCTEF